MQYRRLSSRAEVEDGFAIWNEAHPEYRVTAAHVEQKAFAPFDGVHVVAWGAFDGGDLRGFALTKRLEREIPAFAGPDRGWVSLLAVDPSVGDRSAVANDLLDAAEKGLGARGVERVGFGGDVQHFLPGLPESLSEAYLPVLESRGYEHVGPCHDLRRDVSDFERSERVRRVADERPDLRAAPISTAEVDDLLAFVGDQFHGRWRYEAANICRRPGGPSDYWLLRDGDTPVGFSRATSTDSTYMGPNVTWSERLGGRACGLGPIGIHEDVRGRGWGLYLMSEIIASFRDAGYGPMVIDWTDKIDYYEKVGFDPWETYLRLSKDLAD